MSRKFSRRSVLKGVMGGGGVGIALPALNMFLNGNGTAYAGEAAKLPVRFGTYFWGLGLTPGRWVPEKIGEGWEITPELQSLGGGLEKKVSVFSGFRVHLDGRPNLQHWTGQGAVMSGLAPTKIGTFDTSTFDLQVAKAIGGGTRFRTIHLTPFGNPKLCYSTATGTGFNTPETTPLALYEKLFGAGFQDPNSPDWSPDPSIMVRQSVLSAVTEQRKALLSEAGHADRQKLDQYFTSIREMENQLDVQLQRPAPAQACYIPEAPPETRPSGRIDRVNNANKQMAELMAMALACNQTKVFNVVHTSATSEAYLDGDSKIYHLHTHDEPVDPKLGYQKVSSQLAELSFRGYGDFLRALDAIEEGDGTLLDRTLVLGYSDTGYAKIHSTDNIPMFLAGGAGGAHKGGMHVASNGDPVSRISLTAQQLVGVPVGQFGVGSMMTGKPVTEVMA